MDLNLNVIDSIVKDFVEQEGVNNVPVIVGDNTVFEFKYNVADNTIKIGETLIYSMLPNLVFPYRHNALKRIIFFKHWALNHINNFSFTSGASCLLKLCNYSNSNARNLFCSANHLYLNEIIYFCLLHETTHACFYSSKEYANKEKEAMKAQLDDYLNDNEIMSLPSYVRKSYMTYKKDTDFGLSDFTEEFACDAKALKYIFNSPNFFKSTVSNDEKIACARQILNAIVVQEYTSLMNTLSVFKLNKDSFERHITKHFSSVFRIASAVIVLSDLLDCPSKDFKKCVSLSHKLLKGFNLFNIFDTKYAIADDEEFEFDLDKRNCLLEEYRKVIIRIGKWMMGEDIDES